jgi:uncharacterized protein YndB with AHSA1/START domain
MPEQFVVEQSYFLEAPPKKVFQALTHPNMLVRWFLAKAEVELQDGGEYRFEWMNGYQQAGRVKRVEKNKSIAYHFGSENAVAAFELNKKGGGTLLRLRHDGIEDVEMFGSVSGGWGYYLANLKSVLDHETDLRSKLDRV